MNRQVCLFPSCSTLYSVDQCVVSTDGTLESIKCTFVRFPDHPRTWHRKVCNTVIVKKVKTSHGTVVLKPSQTFCYHSIIDYLQRFLLRPGFQQSMRARGRKVNVFSDIYDGNIWDQFQSVDGVPFLDAPYNYALTLNVEHSMCVIYFTINNLPREVRFLPENIMVVGIIPGPHEPSLHIYFFESYGDRVVRVMVRCGFRH